MVMTPNTYYMVEVLTWTEMEVSAENDMGDLIIGPDLFTADMQMLLPPDRVIKVFYHGYSDGYDHFTWSINDCNYSLNNLMIAKVLHGVQPITRTLLKGGK